MADFNKNPSIEIASKFTLKDNTFSREVKPNPKDKIEVEIGDAKQPDFKPQAKLMRWDNEVNFSLRAQEHPSAIVETEGNLIKYITPEYEVHQYELDPGDIGEDGGLEFEWILPSKPSTNVLTATIQTKGLNFYYQPALTQEEIDEGASRPDNVIGSYAVYHATQGGMNRADGMEYKTGKAFHIYRPQATDDTGKQVWCDLHIDTDTGVLTVTVPQDFLDSAIYPIVVDPTFGYTSVGASTVFSIRTNGGFDYTVRHGNGISAPESGNVTQVDVALETITNSASVDYTAFVNTEDTTANSHEELVSAEVTGVSITTTAEFKSFPLTPTAITAIPYVLSSVGDNDDVSADIVRGRYDSADTQNYYTEQYNGDGVYATVKAEDPWTENETSSSTKLSIYATYTASGGSALEIDTSDSITITESSIPLLTSYISESDDITISEDSPVLLNELAPDNSDDITVTDYLPEYFPESITITESVTVTIQTVTEVNTSDNDSITLSESSIVDIVTHINKNDDLTITESVYVQLNPLQINVSDSITLSEDETVSVQSAVAIAINESESITITEDSTTLINQLYVNTSDDLTLSEDESVSSNLFINVNDDITITESSDIVYVGVLNIDVYDWVGNPPEGIYMNDAGRIGFNAHKFFHLRL